VLVSGESLSLVDRHGVAVVEVTSVEVAGRYDPVGPVGQADGHRSCIGVEGGDHATESVQQAIRSLVPQAHHAIAGAELAVACEECFLAESPAVEHLSSCKTVEVGDVDAPEGENHDIAMDAELGPV
jgi:hypothetical protein